MQRWHLAQVNVAYALGDESDPVMAEFNAQLDEMNALAERSPGFVWRYLTDSRDPNQRELADPRVLFNMSVWDSVESLHAYAYKSAHGKVFAARKKWFDEWKDSVRHVHELGEGTPGVALWWVPAGHIPTAQEALARLDRLTREGPTEHAFAWESLPSVERVMQQRCA